MGNLHGKPPWETSMAFHPGGPGDRCGSGLQGNLRAPEAIQLVVFFFAWSFWSVEAMAIISWRLGEFQIERWRASEWIHIYSMLQESSLELGLSAQLAVCIVGCPKFFPTFGLNQPSPCRSGSLATQDWVVDSCLLWMSNEEAEELKESLYLAPDHAICFKCPSQTPGSSQFSITGPYSPALSALGAPSRELTSECLTQRHWQREGHKMA